jgi:hypothetical protein
MGHGVRGLAGIISGPVLSRSKTPEHHLFQLYYELVRDSPASSWAAFNYLLKFLLISISPYNNLYPFLDIAGDTSDDLAGISTPP